MRSLSKKGCPDWIKEKLRGRKNVEVKEHNGNYYLYGYKHEWDKESKKSVKKYFYLGVLKEVELKRVVEHGHVSLLYELTKNDILPYLKTHFPDEWKYLYVFAMNRVIYPMPLKRMGSWYEKTSLSKFMSLDKVTAKTMSKILERVGQNISGQLGFMRELIRPEEKLLYDGSVIYSHPKYNRLLEAGYNKDKLLLPKANITLLFSKTRFLPVYFKLFFGSVHEVRTIKEVIDEVKERGIIFVADKGYYKNDLFDGLHKNKINFIIPLQRDNKRIKYSRELDKIIEYHKRIIKYTSYKIGNYYVYLYEDQLLKYEETTEYYRFKLNKMKIDFHEKWAGKIALLSNIKADPKEVYLMWKTRDEIEKACHILQNILELDTPYVSKEDVFKGYVFATFISLYMYYKILGLLKEKKINNKISVMDLLFELSKIMIYEKNGLFLEIPKRTIKLVDKIDLKDLVVKTGWS
ncbi:MAG: transposase [Candidatus Anstonellales archaeon]